MMAYSFCKQKPYLSKAYVTTKDANESGLQIRVPRFDSGRGLHFIAENSATYAMG